MTKRPANVDWEEPIPAGEAERFENYSRDIVELQESNAERMDGRPRRTFHAKLYGGLSAVFKVLDDIPAYAKHGVFKEARTFPAWVRISNVYGFVTSDNIPMVVGFVVKLTGVSGTKLLEGDENAATQDFLAINQPQIPVRNADELVLLALSSKSFLTAPVHILRGLGLSGTLRAAPSGLRVLTHRPRSVALESYWSNAPIRLGPLAGKFKWQPAQTAGRRAPISFSRNHLRDEFKRRLAKSDLSFDFMVQFYVDDEKTPLDGCFEWKPEDAPFVKLGELVIHKRDLDSHEAKLEEQYVEGLAFNPWHAIEEHRPLRDIQRARKVIYQASSLNWAHAEEPRDG